MASRPSWRAQFRGLVGARGGVDAPAERGFGWDGVLVAAALVGIAAGAVLTFPGILSSLSRRPFRR